MIEKVKTVEGEYGRFVRKENGLIYFYKRDNVTINQAGARKNNEIIHVPSTRIRPWGMVLSRNIVHKISLLTAVYTQVHFGPSKGFCPCRGYRATLQSGHATLYYSTRTIGKQRIMGANRQQHWSGSRSTLDRNRPAAGTLFGRAYWQSLGRAS